MWFLYVTVVVVYRQNKLCELVLCFRQIKAQQCYTVLFVYDFIVPRIDPFPLYI